MNLFQDFEEPEENDDGADFTPQTPFSAGIELLPPRQNPHSIGHASVEKTLLDIIHSGAMPHALIFSGQQGIGKSTMAFRLARFILKYGADGQDHGEQGAGLFADTAPLKVESLNVNENDPVFRQIASGGHPDFLMIERPMDERKGTQKQILDVETARKVVPFLRMKSSYGGWREVIIDDADMMNPNAQNALLKILEEPPPKTVLILICHRLGRLIPTIRSRCRVISFPALKKDDFFTLLGMDGITDLSADGKKMLLELSAGSIGQAQMIYREEGLALAQTLVDLLKQAMVKEYTLEAHKISTTITTVESFMLFAQILKTMIENKIRHLVDNSQNFSLILPFQTLTLDQAIHLSDQILDHAQQAITGNLDPKLSSLNLLMRIKDFCA